MRFATGGESWDRVVPVFALPYAIWTLYVHLIVAAHAGFPALLHWLQLVLLVAVAATVGWFRLRDPAGRGIGRASCRDRGCQSMWIWVVDVSIQNKKTKLVQIEQYS